MKFAAVLLLCGALVAAQSGVEVFDDPFKVFQFIETGGVSTTSISDTISTSSNITMERTISINAGIYKAPPNDVLSIRALSDPASGLIVSYDTNQNGIVRAEYELEEPINQEFFTHMLVQALGNDLDYNMSFTICSEGCGGDCSVTPEQVVTSESDSNIMFFASDFVGTADFSAADCFVLEIDSDGEVDMSIRLLTTQYWECDPQDFINATLESNEMLTVSDNSCLENSTGPLEACEVCCTNNPQSCFQYICASSEADPTIGVWAIEETPVCDSQLVADPHLTGFNGEKMDIAHNIEVQDKPMLSVFCTPAASFFAELASTPEGDVYIVGFLARYMGQEFSFDIFDGLSISDSIPFVAGATGQKDYELSHGHVNLASNGRALSTDNGVIKATVSIKNENNVYYLDLVLSTLNGRFPAGGMLGRTLEKKMSAEDFNQYEEFMFSKSELAAFECELDL